MSSGLPSVVFRHSWYSKPMESGFGFGGAKISYKITANKWQSYFHQCTVVYLFSILLLLIYTTFSQGIEKTSCYYLSNNISPACPCKTDAGESSTLRLLPALIIGRILVVLSLWSEGEHQCWLCSERQHSENLQLHEYCYFNKMSHSSFLPYCYDKIQEINNLRNGFLQLAVWSIILVSHGAVQAWQQVPAVIGHVESGSRERRVLLLISLSAVDSALDLIQVGLPTSVNQTY